MTSGRIGLQCACCGAAIVECRCAGVTGTPGITSGSGFLCGGDCVNSGEFPISPPVPPVQDLCVDGFRLDDVITPGACDVPASCTICVVASSFSTTMDLGTGLIVTTSGGYPEIRCTGPTFNADFCTTDTYPTGRSHPVFYLNSIDITVPPPPPPPPTITASAKFEFTPPSGKLVSFVWIAIQEGGPGTGDFDITMKTTGGGSYSATISVTTNTFTAYGCSASGPSCIAPVGDSISEITITSSIPQYGWAFSAPYVELGCS